jgi:alkylation response protein AidB-like acyl-CoA dehydrogenase
MFSGLPVVKEAAMCKFLATTVAEATASKCVNWMGGNGITDQVVRCGRQCLVASSCLNWFIILNRVTAVLGGKILSRCKGSQQKSRTWRMHDKAHVTLLQVGQIYEGTSNIQLQTIANILQHEYKSA